MSPYVPGVRKKLTYPLYGADFDPLNQDFLLVGGGGGTTSSGVPNKISLLDTSKRDEIAEIVDIDLAKNEDSVTTLAVSGSSEESLSAIAGINSSEVEQKKGTNSHLRTFRIALPAKKGKPDNSGQGIEKIATASSTQALGRVALFASAKSIADPTKNDTYQRVLRLSPIQKAGEERIAVIATGLAPENEVVAFRSTPKPSEQDVISRVNLFKSEAADVDITKTSDKGYILAYCTDEEVFLQHVSNTKGGKLQKPCSVYTSPAAASENTSSKRPKFRALRFITPQHVLLLQNKPGRTGVNLLILKVSKDCSQGQVILQKQLNKLMKTAVGLDVCSLTKSEAGEKQTIVAVAGQDSSIELLMIDYVPSTGLRTFRPYTVLRDVHSGPLTRLVFANFIGPSLPVTKEVKPQFVRLASVGVDQTVAVHTLHLQPYPAGASKTPRYVLTPPGRTETIQTTFSILSALLVVGLVAFLTQVFLEIRGAIPSTLGAKEWLSPEIRDMIAKPYVFADRSALTQMPSASDVAQEIERVVTDIPPADEMLQSVKVIVPEVPSVDEATANAQSMLSDTIESATAQIPPVDTIQESVRSVASQVPSVEEVKQKIESVIPETIALQDIPTNFLEVIVNEQAKSDDDKAVVLRDTGDGEVSTELHDDDEKLRDQGLKKWDDLSHHQQQSWKRRLQDAGHWAEHQGEGILRGILFSEIANVVGGIVGG